MKAKFDHDFHIHSKLSLCSGREEQTKENKLTSFGDSMRIVDTSGLCLEVVGDYVTGELFLLEKHWKKFNHRVQAQIFATVNVFLWLLAIWA